MIFSLFVIVLPLRAQEQWQTILLKKILENIGKTHEVNFNYIEEEIAILN